jgi:hypothetical protein
VPVNISEFSLHVVVERWAGREDELGMSHMSHIFDAPCPRPQLDVRISLVYGVLYLFDACWHEENTQLSHLDKSKLNSLLGTIITWLEEILGLQR